MKEIKSIPKADQLMGSIRSIGYTFESAIADIIDNSISARASHVSVFFPTDPLETIAVAIVDNGYGMSKEQLFEAMRLGSCTVENERAIDDLGRYGMGLKSASLSQCKILTVVSAQNNVRVAYKWDYNHIQQQKDWILLELNDFEINKLPYIEHLQGQGTIVIWEDFDIIAKSGTGNTYDILQKQQAKLAKYLSLIFHRYLNGKTGKKLTININQYELKPLDPFLESNSKTTTKKEKNIALRDAHGIEQYINVKPFILPFATDLKDIDKELLGGVDNLRAKQGFYVYRNSRLIIWGTWFGMKPRNELTKNARIRVDIPNSLDDIWGVDIKKQSVTIPEKIQRQLKNTVNEALEISVKKETHRGRKESIDEKIDYVWDRIKGRGENYYYQINRDSKLYKFIRNKMTEEDYQYLEMFLTEVEKNFPIQQMYIDKSTDSIQSDDSESRLDDVYQLAITMIDAIKSAGTDSISKIIDDVMLSEPFCRYDNLRYKLLNDYKHVDE